MEPLITVVFPIYKYHQNIVSALDSVIEQSVQNIELIAVDGSGDDRCFDILKYYLDKLTYIKSENSELTSLHNKGLEFSTGEYIIFQDITQNWHPKKLACMLRVLKNNPLLVGCLCESAVNLIEPTYTSNRDPEIEQLNFSQLQNLVKQCISLTMFQTSVVRAKNGFEGSDWTNAKLKLFFQCLQQGGMAKLPLSLNETHKVSPEPTEAVDEGILLSLINSAQKNGVRANAKRHLRKLKQTVLMTLTQKRSAQGRYFQASVFFCAASLNQIVVNYYGSLSRLKTFRLNRFRFS